MAYVAAGITADTKAWDGVSGALPPANDVVFRIDEVKQEASPKKGTPQLVLSCIVVAPEGELKDRKAVHRFVVGPNMKPASIGRLKQLLDACGLQADANGGFDSDHLIGRVFVADIVNEPYQDTDPITGQSVEKNGNRLQNERPYANAGTVAAQPGVAPVAAPPVAAPVAAAPQAVAPAAAPPVAPAPVAAAPAVAPAVAPAPVAAPVAGAPAVAPAAAPVGAPGTPAYPAPGRGTPGVTPVG